MAKITVETPHGLKSEFVHACGQTLDLMSVEYLPDKNLESHINNVRNLEIRDDDIYLLTFPQCGTHWMWEILTMLRRGNAEYVTKTKETAFIDFVSPEELKKIPSPRILNGHYPCKDTPKGIFQKRLKIVHVMRNPKDAFVSMYHHFKHYKMGTFTENFHTFLSFLTGEYGVYLMYPWFKFVKEWERFSKQHPDQVLNIFYEDLKEDTVREIKKVNEFLGLGRDDELVKKIAEACEFSKLKKADAEVKVKEGMLTENPYQMYRKGQVGDWKNTFTVAQNKQMDKWLEENLVETELKFRYTL